MMCCCKSLILRELRRAGGRALATRWVTSSYAYGLGIFDQRGEVFLRWNVFKLIYVVRASALLNNPKPYWSSLWGLKDCNIAIVVRAYKISIVWKAKLFPYLYRYIHFVKDKWSKLIYRLRKGKPYQHLERQKDFCLQSLSWFVLETYYSKK